MIMHYRAYVSIVGFVLAMGGSPGAAAQSEKHWAFRAPERPAPPSVRDTSWPRNAVDAFVGAALDGTGLRPAPEADRVTLLRRLTFDLTGLPPTVEELQAFWDDDRPDAYERVVDRLLASPAYGERWGQHWLDLARYADSDGYEFDAVRPNAWRYRDWVVEALNADMPFDEFVSLQLAGDELRPGDGGASIATGFNRCYPDMVDQNDQKARRQSALNDMTETTGLVFLGLTLGCARCHDHKTDAIPQADFYRIQAFFTPARFRDDFPAGDTDERARYEKQLKAWEQEIAAIEARLATGPPDKEALQKRLDRLRKTEKPVAPLASGLESGNDADAKTYIWKRGEFGARGPEVAPGFLSALARGDAEPNQAPPRSALARWLTDPSQPLTARVLVNRLWQFHFGRGLVATSSDFGLMGDEPSHPELLDWLALELIERGWGVKSIQRLIVTSATYRQSSAYNAEAVRLDPENTRLWRHSRRRLDGEAIRDAMLSASGQLNRQMGGPGVFPELPRELAKLNAQGAAWPVSKKRDDHVRRSLYIFVRRNLRYPFFEAFDRPDTNASCPIRARTTTAPQALSLLNSALVHSAARATAERLKRDEPGSFTFRAERAYLLLLGRPPTREELDQALEFVTTDERWFDLCLALFNVNAFVYVD